MSLTPFYPVMPLYNPSYPHFLPWSCQEPEADSWISLPLLILYAFLGFICFRCCLIPSAGVTASTVQREVDRLQKDIDRSEEEINGQNEVGV